MISLANSRTRVKIRARVCVCVPIDQPCINVQYGQSPGPAHSPLNSFWGDSMLAMSAGAFRHPWRRVFRGAHRTACQGLRQEHNSHVRSAGESCEQATFSGAARNANLRAALKKGSRNTFSGQDFVSFHAVFVLIAIFAF